MSWNWADHAKPYIKIHINFKIYLTISIIKDCKYKGEKKRTENQTAHSFGTLS